MLGKTISHYKIAEPLGSGGMGVVYRAEDTRLNRTVAIKFLPAELARDNEAKSRFMHEARAASALDHPNIGTIHEVGESDDGQLFIVMACYETESLAGRLGAGSLPIEEAVDIARQVAEGLAHAHRKDIVHRDIKPANVMLTPDDLVKIVDFGLAKLSGRTMLTKEGTSLGTIAYMSPEQSQGSNVDHRTDIWAVGAVLYELISGAPPFRGDYDQAVVYSILNEGPESLSAMRSDVPEPLERIVAKCLQKNPAERYQRADELIDDLRSFLREPASVQANTTAGSGTGHRPSGMRAMVMGGAIFAVLVLAASGLYFGSSDSTDIPAARKMLLVLPFENLGPAADDYFADGMTDEITSRLARISSLGVISRKTAQRYRDSDKTTKEIAAELGVDYVLEGSVRWARNPDGAEKVRITPQLIKADEDVHVWTDTYDRIIADIFRVQSDIATNVVTQLDIALAAAERQRLETLPTENIEAYHHFLRGKHFLNQPHFTAETFLKGIASMQQAVALDSGFALAYSELARGHARLIFVRYDISEQRLQWAKSAAETALALAHAHPAVHLNLGQYYLWALRDPDKALAEFTLAEQGMPNDEELLLALYRLYQTEGRWEESVDALIRADALSPRNPSIMTELVFAYWFGHRYEEALEACNRTIALAPELIWPYLYKANIVWYTTGPNQISRTAMEKVPQNHSWWLWSWYWEEVGHGNFDAALALLSRTEGPWMKIKIYARPKPLLAAVIYDHRDQKALAQAAYDSARTMLETELRTAPEDPRYHASLGIAYAGLGRREDALRAGRKATELLPVSKDATYGAVFELDLAVIYAMTGESELALDLIERLLRIPSPLSASWLKMDMRFASLREHPRFVKLVVTRNSAN